MRTTLDIDDRALRAARALAEQRRISIGAAMSELVLRGLSGVETASGAVAGPAPAGFPLLAPVDVVITDDLVAEYRDEA